MVEHIRQNWLWQEPTSVIVVSNYWAISWISRHIMVEIYQADVGSCFNQFCLVFSISICLVSHDIAQWLLTVMTDVGSCSNQFCLMFSTRICLVSHDIAQWLLTGMTTVGSCPSQFCLVFSTICLVRHLDKNQHQSYLSAIIKLYHD
jgi:hypothetical protein